MLVDGNLLPGNIDIAHGVGMNKLQCTGLSHLSNSAEKYWEVKITRVGIYNYKSAVFGGYCPQLDRKERVSSKTTYLTASNSFSIGINP